MLNQSEIIDLLKSIYLFKKCPDGQLEMVAEHFKVWEFSRGEKIFEQGKAAANLYIVVDGQVELSFRDENGSRPMGVRARGEVFGFEMLEYESRSLTTAAAQTNTTLLWLDRESTRHLLLNIPTLNLDLKILFESYLLALRIRLPWREQQESVIFISRRHHINLILRLIFPAVWTLFSLAVILYFVLRFQGYLTPFIFLGVDSLICLLWFVWIYVDWANDYSILTNRRLVYQEKVVMLYDSRQETPLNAVLSAATETDWFGRRFSYGDVKVRTYAGEIIFSKVPYPRQVQALLETQVARVRAGLVEEERAKIEELVRERIGLTQAEQVGEQVQVRPEVKSGKLLHWLSSLFRLRHESGDVIVYWTHWFILLKRILLPSLTLLLLAAALFARVIGLNTLLSLPTFILLVLVLGLLAALWWVYNFIDWRNDHYVITADQIIDVYKKPLGTEERRAAPLKNILSIEFERVGILGLLLNFGTVYILVGETTLTFDYVFNPAEVQRELFNRLAQRDYKEQQQESMNTQKQVADWIEAYHRVTGTQKPIDRTSRNKED